MTHGTMAEYRRGCRCPACRAPYNAYMKKYLLVKYHKRRAELVKLLGGKCALCGSVEGLELDHVVAADKSFELSRKLNNGNWGEILEEAKKCQLLCSPCHRKKSVLDVGNMPSAGTHGTLTSYTHNKCRCVECRAAWAKHNREYKAARKLRSSGP